MAHSDGSHGHSNVNSENYSSQCYSLTIIGIEIWERSVRWWLGGRGDLQDNQKKKKEVKR